MSYAKRSAPKEIEPVIYNNIKYTAPLTHDYIVEAWDIKTNKKLWEKKIYDIKYDLSLEEDVQWVFIKSLSIENGNLLITNEKNDIYELDLKDKSVRKINHLRIPRSFFSGEISSALRVRRDKKMNKGKKTTSIAIERRIAEEYGST